MRATLCLVTLIVTATVAGCATIPPGARSARDPFQGLNRTIFKFNTALDHAVLRPVAQAYQRHTPAPIRHRVTDFLGNLNYPTTIINEWLQGNVRDGTSDIARLVVNTLFGLGGLFDPASSMGLEQHDQDFGLTLGKWGLPSGPFLMLPFLGPSDLRDAIGLLPDDYTTVPTYLPSPYARWSLFALDKVRARAALLPQDRLIQSAFDPYSFERSAYLQNRDYRVHGPSALPPLELPGPEQPPPDPPAAAGRASEAPGASGASGAAGLTPETAAPHR